MPRMLELRPCCEHCGRALPPEATEAMICSFECTFCRDCVAEVLGNVCPNCGGGFCPRPIRPHHNWRGDNHTGRFPPTTTRRQRPVDPEAHRAFVATSMIAGIAPDKR
jgi:uncharacterized protein